MKNKKVKKNSQLLIRINQTERDEFVALCDALDTSAAREIRRFIRQFLADNALSKPEGDSAEVWFYYPLFFKEYQMSKAKSVKKDIKKAIKARQAKIAKQESKLKKLQKQLKKAK